MTFHYRYRKQIIIISIISIILICTIGFFVYKNLNQKENNDIKKETKLEKKETKEELIEEKYLVDIKGEVNNPGIYELTKSSRVIDVINVAGGLTENANTSVINLSKKITDEMVIIIYSNEEVSNFTKTKEIENEVLKNCIQKDDNSLINDACIDTNEITSSNIININTATIEELSTLPGIGESKAKRIIEYREKNGDFETIEDIKKIVGIGDSLFDQIKDLITTG